MGNRSFRGSEDGKKEINSERRRRGGQNQIEEGGTNKREGVKSDVRASDEREREGRISFVGKLAN